MTRHASSTTVPVPRTRGEIERLLRQWGCDGLQWTDHYDEGRATLRFRWAWEGTQLQARMELRRPTRAELLREYKQRPTQQQLDARSEQRWRTRYRQLLLLLRAQLNAVEAGLVTAVEVFMPHLEDGEGRTLGELAIPRLRQLEGPTSGAMLLESNREK